MYKPPNSHWESGDNIKISLGQSHILECYDEYDSAAAKLIYPLDTSNSCYKIQILNTIVKKYFMSMGLTRKEHSVNNVPLFADGTICYSSYGSLFIDGNGQKMGQKWKNGDIIECGIRFPNDGTASAKVYFSINGQLVFESAMTMPQDGFFPTIRIFKGEKVKYWCNQ